jgi:site-specific recombinase XerD
MKKNENIPHGLGFARALKSFVGYLEGTEKSAHTIKNYRLDLLAFQEFLESQQTATSPQDLTGLSSGDLDRFQDHLKELGLKTNTRRRKILTVRRFMVFLVNRGKLPTELGKKIPTPHKIERVPVTVSSDKLLESIRALPVETLLDERNRALLWTLAETGCQVSEVAQLRFEDWSNEKTVGDKLILRLRGKAPRDLPVSRELHEAIRTLQQRQKGEWIFTGFNKFGPLGGAISSRGIELLVKHFGPALGEALLTPRTFRHSAVVQWFREGCSRDEIQKRLGLKTAYAFRTYEPIFKGIESPSIEMIAKR